MSKSQQRDESAYSAGREFYNSLKRLEVPSIEFLSFKNKKIKTISKYVRLYWLKGWIAGMSGEKSGKIRKRILRRKLALANKNKESSY